MSLQGGNDKVGGCGLRDIFKGDNFMEHTKDKRFDSTRTMSRTMVLYLGVPTPKPPTKLVTNQNLRPDSRKVTLNDTIMR